MQRRISWLVAAATSAVVLAFVVPLCLLVRNLAEDRAMAAGDQEARDVAILVSSLHDSPTLRSVIEAVGGREPAHTTVLLSTGDVIGEPEPAPASDALVLRARKGSAFTLMDAAGGHILVPVVRPDGVDVVRTTVTPAVLHEGVTRAWLTIGGLGLVLLLASVLAAARLGRRISIPVSQVARVADLLRDGDLAARAEPTGPPETVALAEALNRLAARTVDLLAAERAAVGDLSHRLRTPVTALRLDVESVTDPVLAERLRVSVGRLQRTVDSIVKDARRPVRTDIGASCDVVDVVRRRVDFWSPLAEEQERPLEVSLPGEPIQVLAHEADVADVLDILVDNVFAHTDEGVGVGVAVRVEQTQALVTVTDSGPGFDPHAERRTDRIGHTGLGLEIARRSVHGFGGDLDIYTGNGSSVVFTVPLKR
jgi:signal transduction histidine kinase